MTSESKSDSNGPFIKALGLWDVVLMSVVAVVGLRWITRGARAGAPSMLLWTLAALAFFVPLAAALAELSSRYPEQGGIYVWARRAFGPVHGFICGWCLWVNNLFYFPSLLLFGAANALLIFGDRFQALSEARLYSVVSVLAALWFCVLINIVGLQRGKWLQNVGSIGTWIPAGLLIVAGAVAFFSYGSATSFAPRELVPREDFLATVSLWSAMCFAFSGFEISAMVGQEVRNPRRTLPLGVIIAGVATTIIYVAGSASVLVAVPASALEERSGIADAIDIVSGRVGLSGLGGLTGLLLALGALAGTSSWTAGAARVPFAAGVDRVLPRAFASLHPRYRTPHVALIIQGIVASAIFLVSVFLTIGGARTTVQEAYDIMVNLTILIYFVPYLYLFAALPRLRRTASPLESAMLVPGGTIGLWLVTLSGFLATLVSLILVFVPPVGTENVLNFQVNLLGQAGAILLIGLLFYRRSGPA
jgi:amino acid transporter